MKNINGNKSSRKFDFHDRFEIEMGLIQGLSFKEIAEGLGCHPISVSREIRNNRIQEPPDYPFNTDCKYSEHCFKSGLCGEEHCRHLCRSCITRICKDFCDDYKSTACMKPYKPPYVCNNCRNRRNCIHQRFFYYAKAAQKLADKRRSESRKGIQIRGTEFALLDRTVSTLVRKGQPIAHICATQKDSIPLCQRSIYNYIERGKLKVKSSDLRRQNGYRKRKKQEITDEKPKMQQNYRIGRSYADFKTFMIGHNLNDVVEMDTVKGKKGSKSCLLTMLFTGSHVMLIFLLPDGTQDSVLRVFDYLELKLGLERFRRIFGIILTDNGSEFKDVDGIELTTNNELRSRVFYCDPMASWQKSHIEKNHEYIRYAIPKGTDMNRFSEDNITYLMNQINSIVRPGLGYKCPYDMISPDDQDMKMLMKLLKLKQYDSADVEITPEMLK